MEQERKAWAERYRQYAPQTTSRGRQAEPTQLIKLLVGDCLL